MAVAFDGLADHRVIDNRQHLRQVVLEQLVVDDLVAIVQGGQKLVLAKGGRLRAVLLVRPLRLLLQRQHARRQQAHQTERRTLLERERCPVVHVRVAEGGQPANRGTGFSSGGHTNFLSATEVC
jgi:hypothetical protein